MQCPVGFHNRFSPHYDGRIRIVSRHADWQEEECMACGERWYQMDARDDYQIAEQKAVMAGEHIFGKYDIRR